MDLKYTLKNNFVLRTLIKPYKDFSRRKELNEYSKSKDSAYIRTLKDIYKGKRCFIIGNGPSLSVNDLELLRYEYTFASNRIYKIFDKTNWRPSFYLAVDNNFIESNLKELSMIEGCEMFLATKKNFDMSMFNNNATRIYEYTKFKINMWNDLTAHISEDVSKYFSVGYTVTFSAIQLAIYMGFKEIYLLGVDFDYSIVRDQKGRITKKDSVKDYFFGEKYNSTVLNYNSVLNAYIISANYAKKNNIKIFNATRGGKLDVFERVNLEDVFLCNNTHKKI